MFSKIICAYLYTYIQHNSLSFSFCPVEPQPDAPVCPSEQDTVQSFFHPFVESHLKYLFEDIFFLACGSMFHHVERMVGAE